MASSTQWEVVGKPKKGKAAPPALSKTQKKQFVQSMPRIEANAPVKESPTIYDSFRGPGDVGNGAALPPQADKPKHGGGGDKKNNAGKKKKNDQDREKKDNKPLTLDQAIKMMDRERLEGVLTQSQASFPDNPEVWLKDLASFLNLCMEKVPEPDPVFKDQLRDYPLCKLEGNARGLLGSTLKKCDSATLAHLHWHCLQAVLEQSAKGAGSYGYRMFLQLIAYQDPSIITSNLNKYLDLLKTHQSRPLRCLAVLWALGQTGVRSLKCGLRVWLEVMLPALGVRAVAAYPVDYLESLFKWHKDRSSAVGEVSVREYFTVLDVVFSSSTVMSRDLKHRLQDLYPILKTLAFGENPGSSLRRFFPSFLTRLLPSAPAPLKSELLSCLVKCLATDKATFSTWCQLYTKHLPQSGELLAHLIEHWTEVSRTLDRKLLRETLRSFSVTNEELASQGSPVEGLPQCTNLTKALLEKMSRSSFPWMHLILLAVLGLSSVILYDLLSSPSPAASRTVQLLNKYGLLLAASQAWQRVCVFTDTCLRWLRENLPAYYSVLCDAAGPWVARAWASTSQAVVTAIHFCRPHLAQAVQWLQSTSTLLASRVYALSPELWEGCWHFLCQAWSAVLHHAAVVWEVTSAWALALAAWLGQQLSRYDLSVDKVWRQAGLGVETVHNMTGRLLTWCSQLLSSR